MEATGEGYGDNPPPPLASLFSVSEPLSQEVRTCLFCSFLFSFQHLPSKIEVFSPAGTPPPPPSIKNPGTATARRDQFDA